LGLHLLCLVQPFFVGGRGLASGGCHDAQPTVGLAFCANCTAVRSGRGVGPRRGDQVRTRCLPDLRVFQPVAATGHA